MDKPAETAHPIHDLIASRWSPRAFDPGPVPAAQIRSLLEAARWAASSFNEQPWSFLVARREDSSVFERMLGCLMSKNQEWAKNAGVLMLTFAKRNFSHNDRPNRVAVHDVGIAACSLTLQAEALGLRVHQMAGIDVDAIRETYDVPDAFEPVTAIAIGRPGDVENLPEDFRDSERSPRTRKAQDEFVFEEKWGHPAGW